MLLAQPRAPGGPTPSPSADARRLLRELGRRMTALGQHTADWWLSHGIDRSSGGFHGTLDREGRPCPPTDKGLIQQGRHLWSFSTWYERRCPDALVRSVADRTYDFIVTHLRDGEDGGFFFKASASGNVLDRIKKLYAQSFAIYALAAYGRVFDHRPATDYALACFRSIDARAHDTVHGGYDQTDDPLSWIGGLAKGTNTHIHLLESFTELAASTHDPLVLERLSELVDLVATRLLRPAGYVHQAFTRDWSPAGDPLVSYGHDLETTWLLLEAARVLGRGDEPSVVEAALAMGAHSSERGFDAEAGGFFYAGAPGGRVTNFEKVWWVQFEALAGLWWLYYLSGDEVHLHRMERTLSWLELRCDNEHGEWFWGHMPDGSLGPDGANKGQEWKSSYHNLRALMFVPDWMAPHCEPRLP